jgi:hypothetical protein|tara:strand:- start:8 stop:169 length:162 start_codon:yes stop_codon:yes gene_type:complete
MKKFKKKESKKNKIDEQELNLQKEIGLLKNNLQVKDLEIGRMMEKINQLNKNR